LAACPNDPDLYNLTAAGAQTLHVSIASGESLTVTVVSPGNGVIVDTATGENALSIDVPQGTLLVKVELASDDTSQGLGARYSLELQ
ncbi:MAG: hypothetical protein QF464_15460, partial [Myxococcota bacterium]|nr:hypothetical protein [Myxococcota bacterium]